MHEGGKLDPLIPLTTNYTFIWPKMTYSLDTQRVGHFLFYRQTQIGGDNLDETFMENGVLLLHAGVSPAV